MIRLQEPAPRAIKAIDLLQIALVSVVSQITYVRRLIMLLGSVKSAILAIS